MKATSIALLVIAALLVAFIMFISLAVKSVWAERRLIRRAWRAMSFTDRRFAWLGFLLFFLIPMVENSDASSFYLVQVFIIMFPALASGFFVAGAIAFAKQMQKEREAGNPTNRCS